MFVNLSNNDKYCGSIWSNFDPSVEYTFKKVYLMELYSLYPEKLRFSDFKLFKCR